MVQWLGFYLPIQGHSTFPHAMGQLSPWATYSAQQPRARALQQESNPCWLQLEKGCTRQWRLIAAKKKKKNTYILKDKTYQSDSLKNNNKLKYIFLIHHMSTPFTSLLNSWFPPMTLNSGYSRMVSEWLHDYPILTVFWPSLFISRHILQWTGKD